MYATWQRARRNILVRCTRSRLQYVHVDERPVAGGTTHTYCCGVVIGEMKYSSICLERGMLIGVQKALVRTVGANPVYIILARILSGSLFINFHHLEISFDIFVLSFNVFLNDCNLEHCLLYSYFVSNNMANKKQM